MISKNVLLPLSFIVVLIVGLCAYKHCFSHKLNLETTNPALLQEITDKLCTIFGSDTHMQSVAQLSEPERNWVLRITLQSPVNTVPKSVIFKQFVKEKSVQDDKQAFARFARDWAGLEFLSSIKTEQPLAPRFYGGNTQYRFILFEDLGENVSLMSSLRRGDAQAATLALERFVKTFGQMHANTYGKSDEYLAILHAINPAAIPWQDELKTIVNKTNSNLALTLKAIGIPYTPDIESEISTIIKTALEPGPFTTFVHGDMCPGNTFDYPAKNELLLIDFEWGFMRNALLDGTYLRMSMPNCWIEENAGTIPEDSIESLEKLYRQELMKKIPAAQNDEMFNCAYVHACAYWMLKSALIVHHILNQDKEILARARVLSDLQTFVAVSKKYEHLPHLRTMVEQILKELSIRWPKDKPLDMFPAFQ